MTTLTIMRLLPREVDPTVFQMQSEEEGKVSFSDIGGLTEQIRELREVIEVRWGGRRVRCAKRIAKSVRMRDENYCGSYGRGASRTKDRARTASVSVVNIVGSSRRSSSDFT